MRYLILSFALSLAISTVSGQTDYQLFRPGVTYVYENPHFENVYREARYFALKVDSLPCATFGASLKFDFLEWLITEEYCWQLAPFIMGEQICQDNIETTFINFSGIPVDTVEHQLTEGSTGFAGKGKTACGRNRLG